MGFLPEGQVWGWPLSLSESNSVGIQEPVIFFRSGLGVSRPFIMVAYLCARNWF